MGTKPNEARLELVVAKKRSARDSDDGSKAASSRRANSASRRARRNRSAALHVPSKAAALAGPALIAARPA